MEGDAGMSCQPLHDLGMLVGRVVVEDDMDQLACGHLSLDSIEETDELLMAVALHAAADDAAVEHIQCVSAWEKRL